MTSADLALEAAKIRSWKWELATNTVESPCFSASAETYAIKDFLKEIHGEDLHHVIQNLKQTLFTNHYHDDGFRIVDQNGDVTWTIGRGYLFEHKTTDENGENKKYIVGFWISVKERNEIELKTTNRVAKLIVTAQLCAMREMVSILSHELSQPLTVISTYISGCIRRIQNNNLDTQQMIDAMERANHHVEMAGNLIHRMKDVLRKNELNYGRVELQQLVERAASLVVPDPNYPPTQIRFIFADNVPTIEVDAIKIKIAILNLIINGIESMYGIENRATEVVVETVYEKENENYVSLLIKDSGCGVPQQIEGKLFDACFSTKKNGVGMGLTISKGIIEEHRGRIEFQSLVNQGTCFKITIPISHTVLMEQE